MIKYQPPQEDTIEGEFTAKKDWSNTISGFLCKKCRQPLMVGDHQCKMCGMILGLTTPPLAYVKSLKVDKQWTFYSDRIDGEELARIKKREAERKPLSLFQRLL